MADKELQSILTNLKRSFAARDYSTTASHLITAKLALLERNALIPSPTTPKPTLLAAREILEVGTLTSIHLQDEASFSRYYSQVQAFYEQEEQGTGTEWSLGSTGNKNKLIGLHLLLLLSRNEIGDFHTTLEVLPEKVKEEDLFIKYPVMLERWLMEGSYDKVWNATKSSQVPSEEYGFFSEVLVGTIRSEIALCSERAYASLPVSNAKNLLFLESEGEVVEFAREKGWELRDGRIYFPQEGADREVLSSEMIIRNTITYAKELETIV